MYFLQVVRRNGYTWTARAYGSLAVRAKILFGLCYIKLRHFFLKYIFEFFYGEGSDVEAGRTVAAEVTGETASVAGRGDGLLL